MIGIECRLATERVKIEWTTADLHAFILLGTGMVGEWVADRVLGKNKGMIVCLGSGVGVKHLYLSSC